MPISNDFNTDVFTDETCPAGDQLGITLPGGNEASVTIGQLARQAGVTARALRFYQSKGLLAPDCNGKTRLYGVQDRDRLTLIQQGKRLGFTLSEIRQMIAARARGQTVTLPISRQKCVEQINLLERQRSEIERALTELRQIYTGMFKAISPFAVERDPTTL